VAGGNSTIKIWRTVDWTLDRALLGHDHHVNAVIPGSDDDMLYSGGADQKTEPSS
jgi:hypothetical protein